MQKYPESKIAIWNYNVLWHFKEERVKEIECSGPGMPLSWKEKSPTRNIRDRRLATPDKLEEKGKSEAEN